MKKLSIKELKLKANEIRKDIILMLNEAGTGHTAGSLDLADLFTTLYFNKLNHNPKNPNLKTRDFVFLSNGHVNPVLYATLATSGYFPKKELMTLRKLGSRLQGHPHKVVDVKSHKVGDLTNDKKARVLPGVENSGGPLGQGISQAVGLAVSLKRDFKSNNIYCFIGDGELEEGQCWEAMMYAAKEKLNNLTIIIDRNNIQIDGNTIEVGGFENLHKKIASFGFNVIEFDGNDVVQIEHVLNAGPKLKDKEKPICLLANTVAGKGISFIEGKFGWHGKAPNNEETKLALEELETERQKIIGGYN